MRTVEPQIVDTNLGPVEVRVEGEGPAVVFSHAAITNHDLWDGLSGTLLSDHRVIRATLPMGAHHLPAAHRDRIELVNLADALVEVLDALDIRQAAFVGCDSGGAVAQTIVARHPERVTGLFLFSCDAFDNFPPKAFRPVCAAMRRSWGASIFELYRFDVFRKWGAWRFLAKRGWTDELNRSCFEPLRDREIRDDAAALFASARPTELPALTDDLAAYEGPVHIAWSRRDILFPKKYGERLAATFPTAELTWFEDAMTFAFLDEPDEAAARLRRFLTERVAAVA
ncbi:MAG: alpha/beta hydrolase [Acidimicrobiales bacterium]|nr:alpha/beta hydrolase [Acidimicrobiales bacterium]